MAKVRYSQKTNKATNKDESALSKARSALKKADTPHTRTSAMKKLKSKKKEKKQ